MQQHTVEAPVRLGQELALAATMTSMSPAESRDEVELDVVDPTNYFDRRMLARGGMGQIFVARDRRLARSVAIKQLHTDSAELRARFEREVLLTARLEHPSIVSVHEAGRWPDGRPFYAMRLVRGRSFDRVIGEAASFDGRLALLPHVLAIADALAYAHQERVIHRDLKPHNVMIGDFGETVVIDWGLSKDLATHAPEPQLPMTAGAPGETEVGEILGTPAYMPPEQADGESVDQRADVYAIGAILYHVLAGAPPYEESSAIAVLDAVRHRAPISLAKREPGVPVDLLAIVDRAMARDPNARYSSARTLADDLRRFLSGQLVGTHRYSRPQLVRRWLRRHRTAVAVGAIAAAVLAVVATASVRSIVHQEHVATIARGEAETNRGDAEDLIGFMMGDLRDKLRAVGKVELLGDVASKAQRYYDHRAPTAVATDQDHRVQALLEIGDVRLAEHHIADALALQRDALVAATTLVLTDPWSPLGTADIAHAHRGIARVLLAEGQSQAAFDELDLGLRAAEAVSARDVTNVSWLRDVAGCHDGRARIALARGDGSVALTELRASVAIMEKVVAGAPANLVWKRDLAGSRNLVGRVLLAKGDVAAALGEYRSGLASAEDLARRDPNNMMWQRDLSVRHDDLGEALLANHDVDGALAEYRASLAIAVRIADRDPTHARDLLVSHSRLATVLAARGDRSGAIDEARAQLAVALRIAAIDPRDAEAQHDLVASHTSLGDQLLAIHDARGAIAAYRASLAVGAPLAAGDPSNAAVQRDVVATYDSLGNAQLSDHDALGAAVSLRAGLALAEQHAASDPGGQGDVAVLHVDLAAALAAHHDHAGARSELRSALAIDEKLAAAAPQDASLAAKVAELRVRSAR